MRLLKFIVMLILAALIALVAYAYLGDMTAPQGEKRIPISIESSSA